MTGAGLTSANRPLDPLGDAEQLSAAGIKKNYAKVGSARPSSLLYTYGPGAVMDLPQFTVMSAGLDDWDRIWERRDGSPPTIRAPRLRDAVARLMRSREIQLRPFPHEPPKAFGFGDGQDLGVPARVFPQWLRCTGCDLLARLSWFSYRNTQPFRPDEACFEHDPCPGRPRSAGAPATGEARSPSRGRGRRRTAVPARYLLVCEAGHLDEFPYDRWVHRGQDCAKAEKPALRMIDRTAGRGASATIECAVCGLRRPMNEAQGEAGRAKLPRCRGRHPHLDAFDLEGCGRETRLMLVGASNLWFAATHSVIVMPEDEDPQIELIERIRALDVAKLTKHRDNLTSVRLLLDDPDESDVSDDRLRAAVDSVLAPPDDDALNEQAQEFDPISLLVPEWRYLLREPLGPMQADPVSGLTVSPRQLADSLRPAIQRVLAVDRLRKVNALVGFTRLDDMDRLEDVPKRLVPLTRAQYPAWTVATEDRGEGVFIQFDESAVRSWEERVRHSTIWAAHEAAHQLNFERRFSETAEVKDHRKRFRPPRYWLVHTFAHVLIRQMAMDAGYSAASLSERLYAWEQTPERPPAAGLLICTTASDSDGTLGGLVQLSETARLERVVNRALHRATRCSSDPVCATRTPKPPEDFLHGAACHCCTMASETSCERANRFLDRRFLVNLGEHRLGFFGSV